MAVCATVLRAAEYSQDHEAFVEFLHFSGKKNENLFKNNIDELSPVCPRKFTRRESIE